MNLIQQPIAVSPLIQYDLASQQMRDLMVQKAQLIQTIIKAEDNILAAGMAKEIRQHTKAVEAKRVELTTPLLEAQRLIKAIADNHTAPLKMELGRIENLATDFAVKERDRVVAEENAKRAEFDRLDKIRLQAEFDAKKLANEAMAVSGTFEQMDNAVIAEKKAFEAIAAVQSVIAAPAPVVNRVSGQQFKKELKFEVLDILEVFKARPELCSLEIKPSAVKATCVPEMPVPGLKLWWENKTIFTSR